MIFLTNNFTVPALTIAQLYRSRWSRFGIGILQMDQTTSAHQSLLRHQPNAVRVQVWTAIAVYLLVAILKKRLHLEASLYTILQILSLTLFEKMPIAQTLAQLPPASTSPDTDNHQCLLGF